MGDANELGKVFSEKLLSKAKIIINEKSNSDKTFRAKVIGKTDKNKYGVLYKGNIYVARCEVDIDKETFVDVCAPMNNWDNLYIQKSGSGSVSGGSSPSAVLGIKGNNEFSYRTGLVDLSPDNIGLGRVENKTSFDIRSEITSVNVHDALGFTPVSSADPNLQDALSKRHLHDNKTVLDRITDLLIKAWNKGAEHANQSHAPVNAEKNVVTGVKGDSETRYRVGDINISKENLGLSKVDNTSDIDKVVNSANQLTTPRNINGIPFDGSKDITVPNLQYFINGFYTLSVDAEGNLWCNFADESTAPPPFYFDSSTFDLFYNV